MTTESLGAEDLVRELLRQIGDVLGDVRSGVPLNLRRNEMAKVLNVCVQEVDRLVKAEAFPSFRIGGQRLARYEDVKAYNDSLARSAGRAS